MKFEVPGKLFITGEYAVLEPGSLALLCALGPGLNVSVAPSKEWEIASHLWESSQTLSWQDGNLQWDQAPDGHGFVKAAMTYGLLYLESLHMALNPQKITISPPPEHFKKGLGSSAAVVVAILKALWLSHLGPLNTPEDKLKLFKLAYLAHALAQEKAGSGADVAAIVFGQVTGFTSFDTQAVLNQTLPLKALINEWPWPHLQIESWPWPFEDHLLAVGWTQKSASTREYIDDFNYFKAHHEPALFDFVFSANASSAVAKNALQDQDWKSFAQSMSQYRRLLHELQTHFLKPIETPELRLLVEAAQGLDASAKSSGAGGGDCGIALVHQSRLNDLHRAWDAQGIVPLHLTICS